MVGVVKRPNIMISTTGQYAGRVVLDAKGEALVVLPQEFPDAERMKSQSLLFVPFTVVYLLTPVGNSMPNLYVAEEVHRLDDKSASATDQTTQAESEKASATVSSRALRSGESSAESSSKAKRSSSSQGVVKASSFSSFETLHNDRVVDGQLLNISLSKAKNIMQQVQSLTNLTMHPDRPKPDASPAYQQAKPGINTATSEVVVGLLPKSRLGFKISGGTAKAVVSWQVSTVPSKRSFTSSPTKPKFPAHDWRDIS
jgi:hypothetical protein